MLARLQAGFIPGSSGRSVRGLRRADRDFRQGRRRERQFRSRHLHPHHRRRLRAGIDRLCDAAVSKSGGHIRPHLSVSGAVRARHRCIVAVLFPRAETRRRRTSRADRQAQCGSGRRVRRGVSRRTAFSAELGRNRDGSGGSDPGRNRLKATNRPAPSSTPRNRATQSASAADCAAGTPDGTSPARGFHACRYRRETSARGFA